jgi:hypothetical protein
MKVNDGIGSRIANFEGRQHVLAGMAPGVMPDGSAVPCRARRGGLASIGAGKESIPGSVCFSFPLDRIFWGVATAKVAPRVPEYYYCIIALPIMAVDIEPNVDTEWLHSAVGLHE